MSVIVYIYIYQLLSDYIACHEYCGECTGPAHTECKPNKCTNLIPHIVMIVSNTCWCDTPYFLNETNNCESTLRIIYIYIYIDCHTLCKSCTGRQRSECIECADTSFELENSVPLFCVASCRFDLISHYPATITTPILTHICKGNDYAYIYIYIFLLLTDILIECEDEGCKYCLGGGIGVCEECLSDYYFHNKSCHNECPEHTFSYTDDNYCYGILYIYCL